MVGGSGVLQVPGAGLAFSPVSPSSPRFTGVSVLRGSSSALRSNEAIVAALRAAAASAGLPEDVVQLVPGEGHEAAKEHEGEDETEGRAGRGGLDHHDGLGDGNDGREAAGHGGARRGGEGGREGQGLGQTHVILQLITKR